MVHISQAERGLACNCVCPECGGVLMAKKGTVQSPHFAHLRPARCNHALESALHRTAKEILQTSRRIWLPPAHYFPENGEPRRATSAQFVDLDQVVLEERAGSIVPDVIAIRRGQRLLIEIAVTHKVDENKAEHTRRADVSMLEIDLSGIPLGSDRESLAHHVVEPSDRKRWIYNARAQKLGQHLMSVALKLPLGSERSAKHVEGCPMNARGIPGASYAIATIDCMRCQHLLDLDQFRSTVFCLGNGGGGDALLRD